MFIIIKLNSEKINKEKMIVNELVIPKNSIILNKDIVKYLFKGDENE